MLSRQQRTRASTKKSSRRCWQLLALLRIEKSLHIRTHNRREGVRMQRPGQLVQELYVPQRHKLHTRSPLHAMAGKDDP